jgi:predicted MPP superfamily phosphohydrolase
MANIRNRKTNKIRKVISKRQTTINQRHANELQSFLRQQARSNREDSYYSRDEDGDPVFNQFGERTVIKTDAIKPFKHKLHHLTDISLLPIADAHFGARESEREKVRRYAAYAEQDDETYVFFGGDNTDTGIPGSLGDTFDQTMTVEQATNEISEIFSNLTKQKKVITNVRGNHENRARKATGYPHDKHYTSASLNAPACTLHVLEMQDKLDPTKKVYYKFAVVHEASKGGPLGVLDAGYKLARRNFGGDLDAVFVAHRHQNSFGTEVSYIKERGNNRTHKKVTAVISMPAFVTTQEYAMKKSFPFSNTDNNIIRIEQAIDSHGNFIWETTNYSLDVIDAIVNKIRTGDKEAVKALYRGLNYQLSQYKKQMNRLVKEANSTANRTTQGAKRLKATEKHDTFLIHLIKAQKQLADFYANPRPNKNPIVKKDINTTQRKDSIGVVPKSRVNKFDSINCRLPQSLTNTRLYAISNVYINSDPESRINLKKLREDIEAIKNDPKALVAIMGNIFEWDDGIFDFKRGESAVAAFQKFNAKVKVVEKQFAELEEAKNERARFHHYKTLSDHDKLAFYKQLISKKGYADNPYREKYDREALYSMQKEAYKPYIRMLAKELKPIADKILFMNPATQENRIENYREYNPLEQLAKELGLESVYTNARFAQGNLWFKNYLTDENWQQASFLATSGVKNANTPMSLQSRSAHMFQQFKSANVEIITGHNRNAISKEEVFYLHEDGFVVSEVRTIISVGGYRKVLEPNPVHLKSYIIQPDQNRFSIDIAVIPDPSYIGPSIIDKNGKVININEDFFKKLHRVENPDDLKGVEIRGIIKSPYRVTANFVPIQKHQDNLYEKAREKTEVSREIRYNNQLEMISTFQQEVIDIYNESMAAMPPMIDTSAKDFSSIVRDVERVQ